MFLSHITIYCFSIGNEQSLKIGSGDPAPIYIRYEQSCILFAFQNYIYI